MRLSLDPASPDSMVRGVAEWKDGEPSKLHDPATCFGKHLTWLREHVEECLEFGQVFPDWRSRVSDDRREATGL